MYKNILVPVVFSEGRDTQGAFLAARALADEGAQFTVLHVVEDVPGYVSAYIPDEVLSQSRDEIKTRLDEAAAALPGARKVLASGHAGRAISDYARDNTIDCVVVASHRPGLQNLILGSTADWVVRHAACSVHVIR